MNIPGTSLATHPFCAIDPSDIPSMKIQSTPISALPQLMREAVGRLLLAGIIVKERDGFQHKTSGGGVYILNQPAKILSILR
jgi:hypothetical protein